MTVSDRFQDACRRLHADLVDHATLAFERGAVLRVQPPEAYDEERDRWKLEVEMRHPTALNATKFASHVYAQFRAFRLRWLPWMAQNRIINEHSVRIQRDENDSRTFRLVFFDSGSAHLDALHRRLSKFRRA